MKKRHTEFSWLIGGLVFAVCGGANLRFRVRTFLFVLFSFICLSFSDEHIRAEECNPGRSMSGDYWQQDTPNLVSKLSVEYDTQGVFNGKVSPGTFLKCEKSPDLSATPRGEMLLTGSLESFSGTTSGSDDNTGDAYTLKMDFTKTGCRPHINGKQIGAASGTWTASISVTDELDLSKNGRCSFEGSWQVKEKGTVNPPPPPTEDLTSDLIDNDSDGLTDEFDEDYSLLKTAAGRKLRDLWAKRAASGSPNPLAEVIGIDAEINPEVVKVPPQGSGNVWVVAKIQLRHSNGSISTPKKIKARNCTIQQASTKQEGSKDPWGDRMDDADEGWLEPAGWPDSSPEQLENFRKKVRGWRDKGVHLPEPETIDLQKDRLRFFRVRQRDNSDNSRGNEDTLIEVVYSDDNEIPLFKKELAVRFELEQTEISQAQFTPPAPRRFFNREVE